jgi:hypothetical protein
LPVLRQSANFAATPAGTEGTHRVGVSQRGFQHDTDVLIRQVDNHMTTLRAAPGPYDVTLAERLAEALRALVVATARASAADRARVRAAVHYFVLRRDLSRDRRPGRPLDEDRRVINRAARDIGRDDLVVTDDGLVPEVA